MTFPAWAPRSLPRWRVVTRRRGRRGSLPNTGLFAASDQACACGRHLRHALNNDGRAHDGDLLDRDCPVVPQVTIARDLLPPHRTTVPACGRLAWRDPTHGPAVQDSIGLMILSGCGRSMRAGQALPQETVMVSAGGQTQPRSYRDRPVRLRVLDRRNEDRRPKVGRIDSC